MRDSRHLVGLCCKRFKVPPDPLLSAEDYEWRGGFNAAEEAVESTRNRPTNYRELTQGSQELCQRKTTQRTFAARPRTSRDTTQGSRPLPS